MKPKYGLKMAMRIFCCILAMTLLFCLTACDGTSSDTDSGKPIVTSENSKTVFGTTEHCTVINTVSKDNFTDPIICKYNNATLEINISYTGLPVISVYSYKKPYQFQDGTVIFDVDTASGCKYFEVDKTGKTVKIHDSYPDKSKSSSSDKAPSDIGADVNCGDGMYAYYGDDETTLGLMDSSGNKLTEPIFKPFFNFYQGYAVAALAADNSRVVIDKAGKTTGTLPAEAGIKGNGVAVVQIGTPGNYKQYLYNIYGEQLCDQAFDNITYFNDKIAAVEKDNKIGLIDDEGNIILEPTIAFDEIVYPPKNKGFYLSYICEDALVVPIGGEFAVISIERLSDNSASFGDTSSANSHMSYFYKDIDGNGMRKLQRVYHRLRRSQLRERRPA